jgi:hypothetical protein
MRFEIPERAVDSVTCAACGHQASQGFAIDARFDPGARCFDLRHHRRCVLAAVVDAGCLTTACVAVAGNRRDDDVDLDEGVAGDAEGRLQRPLLDVHLQLYRHDATSSSSSGPLRIGSATGMRS